MLLSCSESAATPPDDPGPAEQGDWQYHPGSCGRCQTGPRQDSQGDLGALLRSWRDRLSPVDVGLPAGDSRRGGGLRREELASLAGLSVDYVVRLEQGRARRPSAQVAASLARALQLSDAERDHLFVVAGLLPPSPGEVPAHIPPGVQRLVARLGEIPLAVFTASWDLISWSPLWAALLGERFRELWESGAVGEHQSERKVVRSDLVGDVELDCDVFSVAGTDLRIVAYTAASGSEAAAKLDFLRVSAIAAVGPAS